MGRVASSLWVSLIALLAAAVLGDDASGQESGPAFADEDRAAEALKAARSAQSRFERQRSRLLPVSWDSPMGSCEERVGRFCTWYTEGEWYPTEEDPGIIELRARLLEQLDSLQSLAPADDWIHGQRVWYRSQAGDEQAALPIARDCRDRTPWRCAALEGFVLHRLGRHVDASVAFDGALSEMDSERRARWSTLRWPVDNKVRELISESAEPDRVVQTVWTLADPLYLVPGNDRRTAHFARWVAVELRRGSRNPFRIPWGEDLAQLTVRNGWEIGWERAPPEVANPFVDVVGHKHPEGRDYLPGGDVIEDVGRAEPEQLVARRGRPRSMYAPAYAPTLLPMEPQFAVFPRETSAAVVASHHLPTDTTFHSEHDHPLPWLDPGFDADRPDEAGLFLIPIGEIGEGGVPLGVKRVGDDGGLLVEVPASTYLASVERWSPSRRRAGRLRRTVEVTTAVEDVATLSDLLLVEPASEDLTSLESALRRVLPTARRRVGESVGVVWEVSGLGFRPETLDFEIAVERIDRSVFSRVGSFLGLADGPREHGLAWSEPGPREPRVTFHYTSLDIPDLEPGRYRLRLTLETEGRSAARSEVIFLVESD